MIFRQKISKYFLSGQKSNINFQNRGKKKRVRKSEKSIPRKKKKEKKRKRKKK